VATVSTMRGGNRLPLVERVVLVVGAGGGSIVDEEQSWREPEDWRLGAVVLKGLGE
jgi:hypothetical protein